MPNIYQSFIIYIFKHKFLINICPFAMDGHCVANQFPNEMARCVTFLFTKGLCVPPCHMCVSVIPLLLSHPFAAQSSLCCGAFTTGNALPYPPQPQKPPLELPIPWGEGGSPWPFLPQFLPVSLRILLRQSFQSHERSRGGSPGFH
jgi:hypothetical protein